MSQMTKAEIEAAMDQIANYVVSVKVPRLSPSVIEEMTRPKKRRAKKRYSSLDFDDDNSYFEKACSNEIWYPKRKYTRRKRRKTETADPFKKDKFLSTYLSLSDTDKKPFVKSAPYSKEMEMEFFESELVDTDPSSPAFPTEIKTEPLNEPLKDTFVPKIRVKSAAELGSNIIFVDVPKGCVLPKSNSKFSFTNMQPVISNFLGSEERYNSVETSFGTKYDIHKISNLYKVVFTKENQKIIKKVAEILQKLSESIKKRNDKLTEITSNKCTDPEKLMLRHQAHGEFNRIKSTNHVILKKQFEAINEIFNHEDFEILFQLFFLGILKMFIVSVSNKKGTLFKKIVSLLFQSLSNCHYGNEKILNLLKSKDFRNDCIALVHFIEKYSETKFFDMLFISEAEKLKILKTKNSVESVGIPGSGSSFLDIKLPSIIRYTKGMNVLPVGSNLLLQSRNSNSTSKSQFTKTDISKKLLNAASTLPKTSFTKSVRFSSPHQNILKTINTLRSIAKVNSTTSSLILPASSTTSCAMSSGYSTPYSSQQFIITNSNASTSYSTSNTLPSSPLMNSSGNMLFAYHPTTVTTSISTTTNSGISMLPAYHPTTVATSISTTTNSGISMLPAYHLTTAATSISTTTNSGISMVPAYHPTTVTTSLSTATNCVASMLPSYHPTTVTTSLSSAAVSTSSHSSLMPSNVQQIPPPIYHSNEVISSALPSYPSKVTVSSAHSIANANRTQSVIVGSPSSVFSLNNPVAPAPVYNAADAPIITQQSVQSETSPSLLSLSLSQSVRDIPTELPVGDYQNQNSSILNSSCSAADTENGKESNIRTYGPAKDTHKKVYVLPTFGANSTVPKFYPSVCGSNVTSTALPRAPHHFIAPRVDVNGVTSPRYDVVQTNSAFSSYRTISPAGNNENIQPNSPHDPRYFNNVDDNSRLKEHNYSNCPTTGDNDGHSLRALLSDNGRAPLVNQNGHIDVPYQFAEKSNYSPDVPPVISLNDGLITTNHLPIAGYVVNTFPC